MGFRFLPIVLAAAVFGLMTMLFLMDRNAYYPTVYGWGVVPKEIPFWDASAVLTAIDCYRAGVDVWRENACMNGGYYTYSPLLLRAAWLPVGAGMTIAVGIILAAVFLLSQALLPPSRDAKELAIRCAGLLSTMVVFGVERGNFDLVLYVMAIGGTWLLLRPRLRWLGYGSFVLAALLKFYPVTLLILVARERPRTAIIVGATAVAVLAALVALAAGEMETALGVTPVGWPFGDMFGARNIPLGLFIEPNLPPPGTYTAEAYRVPLPWAGKAVLAALVLAAGWIAASHLRHDRTAMRELESHRAAYLVAGAVIITGCFFAAQNVGYRGVFLLLTLPGLYLLSANDRSGAGQYPAIIAVVLFVMWQELPHRLIWDNGQPADNSFGVRSLIFYWAIRELVWWWLIARLASLLGAFLLESPALAPVRRLLPSRPAGQ